MQCDSVLLHITPITLESHFLHWLFLPVQFMNAKYYTFLILTRKQLKILGKSLVLFSF